jgi:hypothetical protein
VKKAFLAMLVAGMILSAIPASAAAASYNTFAGCDDLAENPVPSHVCRLGDFPAAYFEADTDTEYEVCVEFPAGDFLCAEEQEAEAGVLMLNSLTTDETGDHFISWWVGDEEVVSWTLRMDPVPPPPAPVVPVVAPAPVIPPPAVAPAPSAACLKAQQRIRGLSSRVRKAEGPSKAKIRTKLKGARATVKRAC